MASGLCIEHNRLETKQEKKKSEENGKESKERN